MNNRKQRRAHMQKANKRKTFGFQTLYVQRIGNRFIAHPKLKERTKEDAEA